MKSLVLANVTNLRNVMVNVCHGLLYCYFIIAITQLQTPSLHAPLLIFSVCPALFYITTVRFTNPDNLEIANC